MLPSTAARLGSRGRRAHQTWRKYSGGRAELALRVAQPALEVVGVRGADIRREHLAQVGAGGPAQQLVHDGAVLQIDVAHVDHLYRSPPRPEAADGHGQHPQNAPHALKVLRQCQLVVQKVNQGLVERVGGRHPAAEAGADGLLREHGGAALVHLRVLRRRQRPSPGGRWRAPAMRRNTLDRVWRIPSVE